MGMAGQLVAQATTETPTEAEHAAEGAHATDGTVATTEAHGGEHAKGVFPPFDPSTFASQLLWLAITFAALYIVLSRVALPKIGGVLADRKARIDADINAADASRQKTDAAIAAYESALASARRNAQALAEETKNTINADLAAKRKAVEADLHAKVITAEGQIQAAKTEALGHVSEIAGETAQQLVTTLFKPASEQDIRDAVAQVSKE
jgi:F-type H+-transporting ATPase subunit b